MNDISQSLQPQDISLGRAIKDNLGWILLLVLTNLIYIGIEIGTKSHRVQLPAVWFALDGSLYPHDAFVQSLSHYHSLYWQTIAFLGQWLDVGYILIAVHILCRIIMYLGIFSLTWSLFARKDVALLSIGLTVFGLRAILANENLMIHTPTHTQFAQAMMPWALMFLWQRRWIACALLLGLACRMNIMTGLLSTFVIVIAALFGLKRDNLGRAIIAAVLYLMLISPSLYWISQAPRLEDMTQFIALLKKHLWFHMFPLEWLRLKPSMLVRLAGLLLVVITCIPIRTAWPKRRMMFAALGAIILTWIIAVLVSVIGPLQLLVQLQWGRTAALLTLLMLPMIAHVIVTSLETPSRHSWLTPTLIGLGWAVAHSRNATILLAAILCLYVLWNKCKKAPQPDRKLLRLKYLTALLVVGLFVSFTIKNSRTKNGFDEGFILRSQSSSNLQLQQWAREHTAKDALFLASVEETGSFRTFSRRSLYCTQADVVMMSWKADTAAACDARIEEWNSLGLNRADIAELSPARFNAFCQEKGIDYLILPTSYEYPGPQSACFQNQRWTVYPIAY